MTTCLGGADVDDVSLRRLRNKVLAAVDAEQTGRARSGERGARSRAAIVAVLLTASVTLGVAFGSRREHGPRVHVMPPRMRDPALLAAASKQVTQPSLALSATACAARVTSRVLVFGRLFTKT
jgi:hypothetical protein